MLEQQQHQYQEQVQQNQHTQNLKLPQQQQQQQQFKVIAAKKHNNKNSNNKQNLKIKRKSLYLGNIHISATENVIYDFFGLPSIKYLQKTCKVDLPLWKTTGKSKKIRVYSCLFRNN